MASGRTSIGQFNLLWDRRNNVYIVPPAHRFHSSLLHLPHSFFFHPNFISVSSQLSSNMHVSSYFPNEAICLAQLGTFALLPPEIRLLIWEGVFQDIPTMTPDEQLPPCKNVLSVLRASRYLYHEISVHLYKDMAINIQPRPQYHQHKWMTVRIFSKKLDTRWCLKTEEHTRRFFHTFPFAKVNQPCLGIDIVPSSRNDPGLIISTRRKINTLIDIFKTMPFIPPVHISLSGKWAPKAKPRVSIKTRSNWYPDHDIVVMPFTCLPSWRLDVPSDLEEILRNEPDSPDSLDRSLVSYLLERGSCPRGINLDMWCTATNLFLESMLEITPGLTASNLRLARFKPWYGREEGWEEAYRRCAVDIDNKFRLFMRPEPLWA